MKKLYALVAVLASAGLIYGASTFSPSTSTRGLLVDVNGSPYSIGTAGAAGSFNPSNSARVQLVDQNGQPYKAATSAGGSVTSITASAPLSGGTITTSGSIGCPTATGSVAGCLTAANWTTFNAKQAAGNYITALTGAVTASGPGSVAATIASDAVTTVKILNSNVTLAKIANAAASSKLLGSGASGSGSPYAELTLGTNLSMSGTTLNASGGTSGLTLVEHKTFTANATSYTFSNLDGDTDGEYNLNCKIINKNGGGGFFWYTLQPNGSTSNQVSQQSWSSGTNVLNGTSRTDLPFSFANADGGFANARATIFARRTVHSVAMPFSYEATGFLNDGGTRYVTWMGGQDSTTGNVTSMNVVAGSANGIGDGSECWLYKYAQ